MIKSKSKLFSGLIIAGGFSSRMVKFKPLLPFGEDNFLNTIISKLANVCDSVIVVGGYRFHDIKKSLQLLNEHSAFSNVIELVENHDFANGMFTSLQKGIAHVKTDWVIYHFVDQPSLPLKFYEDFVKEIDDNFDWIQPANDEKKGHPILIHKNLFGKIISSPADSSLKNISEDSSLKKKIWNCGYPEIFQDIDTSEDYQALNQSR